MGQCRDSTSILCAVLTIHSRDRTNSKHCAHSVEQCTLCSPNFGPAEIAGDQQCEPNQPQPIATEKYKKFKPPDNRDEMIHLLFCNESVVYTIICLTSSVPPMYPIKSYKNNVHLAHSGP